MLSELITFPASSPAVLIHIHIHVLCLARSVSHNFISAISSSDQQWGARTVGEVILR